MQNDGIARRIAHCSRQLDRLLGKGLSSRNLGSGQVRLLVSVLENPGVTQDSLSRHVGIDKTTTAKAVSRLENSGYLNRLRDSDDRRLRRLFPTEKARNLRPELEQRIRHIGEVLLMGFMESEIHRLAGFLSRMQENLLRETELYSGPAPTSQPTSGWD